MKLGLLDHASQITLADLVQGEHLTASIAGQSAIETKKKKAHSTFKGIYPSCYGHLLAVDVPWRCHFFPTLRFQTRPCR